MGIHPEEDAVYFYALSQLKGIGPQILLRLVTSFPKQQELMQASPDKLEKCLGRSLSQTLYQRLHHHSEEWQGCLRRAQESMQQHVQAGIIPIPITSQDYPPLLKLITDPPVILYVKGNISLLKETQAVAIVGTREPTLEGKRVASALAERWAAYNYVIVSGLAKGIDTAAHEGALKAGGKTIAVFGTPLDTTYPAENKDLASRILRESGVLISELALGQRSFGTTFVRRDRIQSGLSLCVIPVQTRNDGGTMHTVNFARMQKRYIVCPRPSDSEASAAQYEGIWFLIRQKKTPCFKIESEKNYSILKREFQELRRNLLMSIEGHESETETDKVLTSTMQREAMQLWDFEEQKVT